MTPEQRQQIETQIQNDFSELQKKLENLKSEVQWETDDIKKQEKNEEIKKLEEEAIEIESLINRFSQLQEEEVQALKTRLEEYRTYKQEVLDVRQISPTTYELLKDSETCNRLRNIIESNPNEFKNLPWDTAEKKLEYIFTKIRNSVVLFMKNKLWDAPKTEYVINNTIAPAFEWSLMEMLRDQWNETNVSMLKWMDKISRDSFNKLVNWVSKFANKTAWSYNKFSQWINAVDYLSVHNWVLREPNKSEVLSNPLKFKEYLNDSRFSVNGFSPYAAVSDNIFKIDGSQNFEFGMSDAEKQAVLEQIWNIQVVNNPKTTALIASMLDKPEQFLQKTQWLQQTANGLLDWLNSINSVTKVFWVDILWEITKAPEERNFLYKIMDFVCKLIWITWWLEWVVKKWRMDRMNLTDEKNNSISQIFDKFKEKSWENVSISVTWADSCKSALNNFAVSDPKNPSVTMWDYLRDSMIDNMNIDHIAPWAIEQTLWASYLKKEIVTVNGKQTEKILVDTTKIWENEKKMLAHKHLQIMKNYLESDYESMKDFYSTIHSTQDLALCITASLYVDKDDVIEWVKAKVFLPENYGAVRTDWSVNQIWWDKLDSAESSDKQKISEKEVYDKAIEQWVTDKSQIAYILSTINWECWFRNIKEDGWEKQDYWKVDAQTQQRYYGRWFVQVTHKSNYEKFTKIIKEQWKDFKDNNGNVIKSWDVDLVANPDLVLKSNEIALFITIYGMKNGIFTGKKLDDYIKWDKVDFKGARQIVNWNNRSQEFANNAQSYLDKLWKWSLNSPIESNELLIWPKLLAHNKDEIGWLWNSIMNWFQWLNNKSQFPNMDWIVWKNTQTHPNRFNSQNDVLAYKNAHPNVKSFLFYFWANSADNNKTISDITQRSSRLAQEWIQPVLSTCIWENSSKTPWLKELNQQIIALWKEKNRPVIDFAKSDNKWNIAIWADGLHPTSYTSMTNIINAQLKNA